MTFQLHHGVVLTRRHIFIMLYLHEKIAGLSTIVITLMLPLTAIMAMISTVQPLVGQSEWFGYADVFSPNHEGNHADPSTASLKIPNDIMPSDS